MPPPTVPPALASPHRAILPVMPRFFAALLPVLPAMAHTPRDAGTAAGPAAAAAAAAAAARLRAAVGTGPIARMAVGAAVAAGSADQVAECAAEVSAGLTYGPHGGPPHPHHVNVQQGGGAAAAVPAARSVWERALGVAGVWAAALALLPECAMPYLPASANCCSAAGAESMWAAATSAPAGTFEGDGGGGSGGGATGGAGSVGGQKPVSAAAAAAVGLGAGSGPVGGGVSGGAAVTLGQRHGSLGPEFPAPGAVGDAAAFAASADAAATHSTAAPGAAGGQTGRVAVAAAAAVAVASRNDAAAEAAVAGAAATTATAAAGAAVAAAVAASGAAAAAELRYAAAAAAALHQTAAADASQLWSQGWQNLTAPGLPARVLRPRLQTFERQPLLQSRQRAEELQRWHAQAGLWGGGGLPQAAADVATAMQQGLHESGMLSFRGWSGSLRRQVLLRGRGGFASSAGRRGAGGSAEPRNWLSGRRV